MLIYGIEVVIPMEYIVASLHIVAFTGMVDHEALQERPAQLTKTEEDIFFNGFP